MTKLALPTGYENASALYKRLQTEPESEWIKRGQLRALNLFHEMANRVPAYKDFLKKYNFNKSSIQKADDFSKIPVVDKNNYLRAYERADLCWDGKFAEESWVISTTSGSTGQPYYFPRTELQDQYLTTTTELYMRGNFGIQNKTTLYIDAFPMGAWIGGVFTYESVKQIAERGYAISIITPGIHKQEVINAIKQLGQDFDQIIIGAYAPFLKDILDDGRRQGLDWKAYDLGFVFSAEAFSEKFRDYVFNMVGTKDILRASLNHYGTVDLGTMAHETPLTVMIRRQLVTDDKLGVLLPEDKRQPTVAQYDPSLFYFEQAGSNLICSSFSGLPLVRYDLQDYGGVITKADVTQKLHAAGYDLDQLIKEHALDDTVWNLPFVYVYERNDFSVSYYAFLVYPDMVRRALEVDELTPNITGKFTMLSEYNDQGRQKLHIHIELRHGIEPSADLSSSLTRHIHDNLLQESSEYRETFGLVGDESMPLIQLWHYEDPTYFRSGTKQKWVIK